MQSILADITAETFLGYPVIWARLVGAVLLGGLIGFEREVTSRPAGLRTHAMVSLAACAFAVLAVEVTRSAVFSDSEVRIDPLRVIEAVTAGVAFLAAGIIVLQKGHVRGLTTGAGVWLAAAIGLGIGFGYWAVAIPTTIIGGIVLTVLRSVEKIMGLKD